MLAFDYPWHLAAAVILATVTSLISVLIPRLLGQGVDQAVALFAEGTYESGEIKSMLLRTGLIVILVSAFRGSTGFASVFLGETLSQRVANRLRILFFDKLQILSFRFPLTDWIYPLENYRLTSP